METNSGSNRNTMSNNFKVGDSVVVKSEVIDPDLGFDLGGWQGRISEIPPKGKCICIKWDSITLENMPYSVIAECEERGLDWGRIYLSVDELELANPRDTQGDVKRKVEQLESEHVWDFVGPEGKNINKILAGIERDDTSTALKAWYRHLCEVLSFPFEARVVEYQVCGPLQSGDHVLVKNILAIDDLCGVIVQVKYKGLNHQFPLCDFEATDTNSANHDYVQEYAVWFANR
jgi:hypothetical protein